jgi:hypothetical protein
MRKLLIVLAVIFAASLWTTAGVGAATCPTKHHVMRHHVKTKNCRMVCRHKKKHHKARAASVARGPIINVPAPVVNVPQGPAPVVNVPQQPAPVINEAPTVGITVDSSSIYIVRGNQLTVLDKCSYECKKTLTLP